MARKSINTCSFCGRAMPEMFTGIEDDVLITSDGCRFLGEERIPYHPKDVEDFMAAN